MNPRILSDSSIKLPFQRIIVSKLNVDVIIHPICMNGLPHLNGQLKENPDLESVELFCRGTIASGNPITFG